MIKKNLNNFSDFWCYAKHNVNQTKNFIDVNRIILYRIKENFIVIHFQKYVILNSIQFAFPLLHFNE